MIKFEFDVADLSGRYFGVLCCRGLHCGVDAGLIHAMDDRQELHIYGGYNTKKKKSFIKGRLH